MSFLQDETTSLRRMMARKPTPKRRAKIDAALQSKFESVQSVALEVLSAWSDPVSLARFSKTGNSEGERSGDQR